MLFNNLYVFFEVIVLFLFAYYIISFVHANTYCKLLYSEEDFMRWKNLCPITSCLKKPPYRCLITLTSRKICNLEVIIWNYNYLCNQCISPLALWIWIPRRLGVLDTTLCDKVCQWLAAGRWFSLGTMVSSTSKTDRNDITEILLKVALNAINQTYI